MAAHTLKAEMQHMVAEQVRELTAVLLEKRTAPLDEIRLYQGSIEGLKLSLILLDQAYKAIGG